MEEQQFLRVAFASYPSSYILPATGLSDAANRHKKKVKDDHRISHSIQVNVREQSSRIVARAVRKSAMMQAALGLRKRHLSSRQRTFPAPVNNVFYAPVTSDLMTEPLWAGFLGPKACGKAAATLLSLARGLVDDFTCDANELCCMWISRSVGFDSHHPNLALR
jgi:hypothetical protein